MNRYRILRSVSAGAEAAVVNVRVNDVDGKVFLPKAFKAAYDAAPRKDVEHPTLVSTSALIVKSQTPWSRQDPISGEVKSGLNTTFAFEKPEGLKIGFIRPIDTAAGAGMLTAADMADIE